MPNLWEQFSDDQLKAVYARHPEDHGMRDRVYRDWDRRKSTPMYWERTRTVEQSGET